MGMVVAEIMRVGAIEAMVALAAIPLLIFLLDAEEQDSARERAEAQEAEAHAVACPIEGRFSL